MFRAKLHMRASFAKVYYMEKAERSEKVINSKASSIVGTRKTDH